MLCYIVQLSQKVKTYQDSATHEIEKVWYWNISGFIGMLTQNIAEAKVETTALSIVSSSIKKIFADQKKSIRIESDVMMRGGCTWPNTKRVLYFADSQINNRCMTPTRLVHKRNQNECSGSKPLVYSQIVVQLHQCHWLEFYCVDVIVTSFQTWYMSPATRLAVLFLTCFSLQKIACHDD